MAASFFRSLSDLTTKILSYIPHYFPSPPSSSSSSSKSSLASKLTKEITKLDRTMRGIQAVLADAEEREIRDESVKFWLFELKQVAYSAEEVLEDFNYELQKRRLEANLLVSASSSREDCDTSREKQKLVSCSRLDESSFIEDLLGRIMKVKEELDDITHDRDRLSLREDDGLLEPGRTSDPPDHNSHEIQTISIIGMGGMGKTTLARLVYNDVKVKNHFNTMSWVWVSEVYDQIRLTRAIIESITGKSCNMSELHTLQIRLTEVLNQKMFLLVLDDIWNEDPIRWETLKMPLSAGASGSRVIITTRNKNVASVMDPKLALHLDGLKIRDSWDLFCQFAFKGKSVQDAPSSLITIGQNIVKKSNGVPLVVRILGSLLSSETSEESWNDILRSDTWELDEGKKFIFPILKISYERLPSALKPCFAYCASFPKGYEFDRDDLVKVWDALGFIPSDRKNDPIAIGISFVDDLISRSFFQIKFNRGSNKILTMHDLIHDLASLIAGNECFTSNKILTTDGLVDHLASCIAGNECFTLQNNASTDVLFSSHIRHFYGCPSCVPINRQLALRSFYCVSDLESGYLTGLIESGIFQYLKVLDISPRCPPNLCESIGYFKHLRYVSFSQPKIPESVCLLYNLETLQNKDKGIVESQLPMDLCRLISLKHLIVPNYFVKLIPVGISRLRNLQTLSVFAVCHDKHGASLAELKELNNLKRKFCITQLHNLTCDRTTEAEEACLSKKEQLTHLTLDWTYVPLSASISHEQVLNYLRPHTGIQTIEICNYSGRMFPDWLGDRKFSRISTVKLTSCYYCEKLPSLGELPCLKHLYLSNVPELKCIGSEFYGNSNVSFPLLETLRFGHMPDWVEWWTGEGDANLFPCLVNLELVGCWMLNKSFSVINMPSLKTVSVGHCDKLTIEGRESHPHLQVNKLINYTWKSI